MSGRWSIITGDCLEVLPTLGRSAFDAVVTDPPYELGFMGKRWDRAGVAFDIKTWWSVKEVMKPGAHLLAFGGTRTFHRLTVAIEEAGFEIRDCLMWLYGSGFPKSLDVSKAIDGAAGAERDKQAIGSDGVKRGPRAMAPGEAARTAIQTMSEPATDAARRWQGWGTALKPAWEPIILARKPLEGTVAANVEKHGTGAINVEACRLPGGRWPANVLLDEETAGTFEGSRFFYTAKISRSEREAGVWHLPPGAREDVTGRKPESAGQKHARSGMTRQGAIRNLHPTVKPVDLMRWLVRLVTPPGGRVLDPFAGSGSTGIAAILEGARFMGIEQSPEYAEIARARIYHHAGLDFGARD